MHPAQIQAALKMRGASQASVALQCGGVSRTAVYQVIYGRARSRRIETRIAAITGLPLAELWPEWHGPTARRSRRPIATAAQVAEAMRAANR